MLAVMSGATGCDPCFGISSCDEGNRTLAYSMRVVDPAGRPVEGVRVEVVPEPGSGSIQGQFQDLSDANGLVEITGTVPVPGSVPVELVVTRPSGASYRVGGVTLETTREGNRLYYGNIRSNPYTSFVLEVVQRATGDTVPVVAAAFQRTGGIPMPRDTVAFGRNNAGMLALHAEVDALGDLFGTMSIRPATRDTVLITAEHRIPTFVLNDTSIWVQVRVGPSLAYMGRVLPPLDGGGSSAGVKVYFQQTGGIPLVTDSLEMTTDADGFFPVPVRPTDPWAMGEVVGRLRIVPQSPYVPIVVEGVRLRTFNSNAVRLIDEWRLTTGVPFTE